jgi:hypothetical protein
MQSRKRGSAAIHDSGIKRPRERVKNEFAAIDALLTAGCDLQSRRYFGLIRELADEHGAPKHGWRIRVSARLGINQSFLSRLLSGERATIGADSIDKAVMQLGMRRAYFEDHAEPASYTDFVGAAVSRTPTFTGWFEFLASPIGRDITPGELRTLASTMFEVGYQPTAAYYEGHLYMLRSRVTHAEMQRGIEKAAELAERMRRSRRRQ